MKTFTSAIMDCLVVPLQEKLEDWKKTVINLDKDHAKDSFISQLCDEVAWNVARVSRQSSRELTILPLLHTMSARFRGVPRVNWCLGESGGDEADAPGTSRGAAKLAQWQSLVRGRGSRPALAVISCEIQLGRKLEICARHAEPPCVISVPGPTRFLEKNHFLSTRRGAPGWAGDVGRIRSRVIPTPGGVFLRNTDKVELKLRTLIS
uniref:IMD domain-containing protein n=1 Tax=Timema cristinae TaxID=61476 RepID=A0A7R9CF20_TIMCR|nr:unnamed protein product [Timema cristinae]